MANEENLTPFTKENAREMGRKGGKASGESRRRKANIRKVMNDLLVNGTVRMNGEEMPYEVAICYAMIREALDPRSNNVAAFRAIMAAAGQTDKSELEEKEQKARIKAAETAAEIARKKLADETSEENSDNDFLAALNGTASTDWENDDEEG